MSKEKKRTVTVIKGGTLIDGTGAKPLKNSVVVVEGNRIVAAGKEGDVDVPRKVKKIEIDANGQTIMPGLIDSHLHFMGLKTDRILEEEFIRPQ